MFKRQIYFFGFALFLLTVFFDSPAAKAVGPCFCVDQTGYGKCISATGPADCMSKSECIGHVPIADSPAWEQTDAICDTFLLNSNYRSGATSGGGQQPSSAATTPSPAPQAKSALSKLITDCGQLSWEEAVKAGCGDVTVFISLALQIVKYLFGIIGSVALLFFVYGGFVFILSQGNAEQVSHGKAILTAAVLGIVIAFSGYALIRFMGDVVGIKSEYRLF